MGIMEGTGMMIGKTAAERAKGLLSQMTLKEKIGQVNQRLYGFRSYVQEGDTFTLTDEFKEEVEKYSGLGTLYGLYRADPWSAKDFDNGLYGERALRAYNLTQKYVLDHSRLKIPMMMSTESPHGHQALNGYLLPVNLAAGASFHPELLEKAEAVCAKQLSEMGVDLALVSMLDILRDPRWGRSEECLSEDPYLSACMAGSMIRGIHSEGVGVIAKHFCAQGETSGGLNGTAARIGERELFEIHLPTAAVVAAEGAEGVMAAYNEIDGEYCHGNRHLLTDILRGELGFKGVVMSDGVAIDRLNVVTGDLTASGAMALNAGVDIGLWDQAFSHLEEAIEQGLVSEETLNEAVLRVLTLKFERGLFDTPFVDRRGNRSADFYDGPFEVMDYSDYDESRKLAEESAVLLKNEGQILPLKDLKAGTKIAVIGPNANHIYRQIGDYSPEMKPGSYVTVLDGLRKLYPECDIAFCEGEDIREAVTMAKAADKVIMVLGGSSSRFSGVTFDTNGAAIKGGKEIMDCGEGVDCADLKLPGNQHALFDAIKEEVKSIITVVIAGRPYAIEDIAAGSNAILYAFYPGPWGGSAIASLLKGDVSPSGRMPASMPRSAGQLPVYYNPKTSNRLMNYYDIPSGVLYGFGEGMGYGKILCRDFQMKEKGEEIIITYTAENPGATREALVMQCYRHIDQGTFAPRDRELIGFSKEFLEAGETRRCELNLGHRVNMVFSQNRKYEAVKGKFHMYLMDGGEVFWETHVEK